MTAPFGVLFVRLLLSLSLPVSLLPMAAAVVDDPPAPDHLVVSEVVTGGATASDELIELFNPTSSELPLEGLELVYASATGTTVSRRAAWDLGASSVPPGGHVLVANVAGIFAAIADATYASGMAATGGSVALRIQGAVTAVDAVGWGTAASTWLEGNPAPAPAAGASLERLPGGMLGSAQDTDDNATDFVERPVPEPQNSGSPLVPPGTTPTPLPSETAEPTAEASAEPTVEPTAEASAEPTVEPTPEATPTAESTPTAEATPTPEATPTTEATSTPDPIVVITPIATARALPDGATVTIEGVAVTPSDFHDGGGFVADATGGLAVLATDATFARGDLLRVTGQVDDRFSQRTLRAEAADIINLGTGAEPAAVGASSGSIGEALEGRLVSVTGSIVGAPTTLTSGLAFDLDDGSGAARLIVGAGLGIDTAAWQSGAALTVTGVVGQRDSSGTGTAGYRLMPRDAADVSSVQTPASASPSPSSAPTASPTASPSPSTMPGVSLADARVAPKGTRLTVTGVVTLPTGIVDSTTAVIADATGAIVLRLGSNVGRLALGERIEVTGIRSTKSGMETLRVSEVPRRLVIGALPEPLALRTGQAGEAHEAQLVVVRGALVHSARRAPGGSTSFEVDDGSGPLKVVVGSSLRASATGLTAGTWVEVRGVLGQQTTRSRPASGYRLWTAERSAVRLLAQPAPGPVPAPIGGDPIPAPGSFDDLEGGGSGVRIGATLVSGASPELGIGGLLWDGVRLVAIDPSSADIVIVLTDGLHPPIALDLGNLRVVGTDPATGIDLMALGRGADDVVPRAARPASPARIGTVTAPAWVSVVGRLVGPPDRLDLLVRGARIRVDRRCSDSRVPPRGLVVLTGVALPDPLRLVVGCDGLRTAPTLAMAPIGPASGGAVGPTSGPAAPIVQDPVAPTRGLAVGGLLAAATLMIGTAAFMRLRRPDGPGGEPAASSEHAVEGTTEVEIPALTLVHVARERGP